MDYQLMPVGRQTVFVSSPVKDVIKPRDLVQTSYQQFVSAHIPLLVT
jgi:hypothetical protein